MSDKPTTYTAKPVVWLVVRGEYREGGGVISEMLAWMLDQNIYRAIGLGMTSGSEWHGALHEDDAARVVEWLKNLGATRGRKR